MTGSRISFVLPLFVVGLSHAWTLAWTLQAGWTRHLPLRSLRRTTQLCSASEHLFSRNKQLPSRRISGSILQDLSRAEAHFPYTISDVSGYDDSGRTSSTISPGEVDELTIRLIEWSDIGAVTDICVDEYGDKPDVHSSSVLSPDFWVNWAEYVALRPLVDLSMRLKVRSNTDPKSLPGDHAVLVACLRSSNSATEPNDGIVGMVELSRQPLRPERNPPPLPIPLALKRVLFAEPLQGWITNLLVVRGCRGRGYAKVMLAACDGMARRWGCQSISLHCDADADSGRAAQHLYAKCGYRPLDFSSGLKPPEYSWISPGGAADNGPVAYHSSVFVVDDVPLLYLQKELD